MKRFLFLFLFLLLTSQTGWASPPEAPSLFFTEEEIKAIEAEIAARPQDFFQKNQKRIHLDSLLYYGPDQWTLWLESEKWTPQTQKDGIQILEVAPQTVRLRITMPLLKTPRDILLHPHQSFDLMTGEIVEGR